MQWRFLRNTYATVLAEYEISIKAIAVCLGHYSPVFTNDTYVDATKIVYDVAVEITDFAMDVMPGRKTNWILTLIVHIYLKLFLKMYIISKIALIKDLQKIIFLYQTMLHNAV